MDTARPRRRSARELAALCVESAESEGYKLELPDETPVVPDELYPDLVERGTWGEIDAMTAHWTAIGCSWVNLRFAIEDGRALIRYEARPDGEPLRWRGPPHFNGGFDLHRIIGQTAFAPLLDGRRVSPTEER
jgi:hypothetical protein